MKGDMLVRDLMEANLCIIFTPEDLLYQAVRLMRNVDSDIFPVTVDNVLVGIVTDRIALNAIASGHDPKKAQIKDIMTRQLVYCSRDDTIETAAKTMGKHNVRQLIVLNDRKHIVGVLSLTHILQAVGDERIHSRVVCSLLPSSRKVHDIEPAPAL